MTEYKLTGLLPMSRYIVLVQGERDGRYTSIVTTEFITGIFKIIAIIIIIINHQYLSNISFVAFLFFRQTAVPLPY